MRYIIIIFLILLFIFSACQSEKEKAIIKQIDLDKRISKVENFDAYHRGKTYLPIYSHIYHIHEHQKFNLTITISIRNVSITDTIHILNSDYYDTIGKKIRQYIKKPIFLKPMETIEIIIDEIDNEGGSGANFIFDWAVKNQNNPPLFEAIMISTYGQQGISFSTRGIQIFE